LRAESVDLLVVFSQKRGHVGRVERRGGETGKLVDFAPSRGVERGG
jgi:hypothetical protein